MGRHVDTTLYYKSTFLVRLGFTGCMANLGIKTRQHLTKRHGSWTFNGLKHTNQYSLEFRLELP